MTVVRADSEQEWRLAAGRRILLLFKCVGFSLLEAGALAGGLLCCLSLLAKSWPLQDTMRARILLGGSAICVVGGAVVARQLVTGVRVIKKQEWFCAAFLVSSYGIAKVMPSGTRFKQVWADLVGISSRLYLMQGIGTVILEFRDGTRIDIPMEGGFAKRMLGSAANLSGADSELCRLLAASRGSGADKVKLALKILFQYSVFFAAMILMAWVLVGSRWGGLLRGFIVSMLFLWGVSAAALMVFMLLKLRKQDT
jgi:hypothetical protein